MSEIYWPVRFMFDKGMVHFLKINFKFEQLGQFEAIITVVP
jgi:hypothetical protein